MARTVKIVLAAAVLVGATAGIAAGKNGRGKQVRYVGVHPIAKAHGKGLCHIEAPHVHVYGPAEPVQYRDHEGAHYFVGDPVAYGWQGDKHSYYGHHPIYVDAVVDMEAPHDPEFCYLNGPHFHTFAPPLQVATDFKVDGDAYFYVGTPPPVYVEARPAMVSINAIYEPIVYTRPVVTVEPPAAWIGVTYAMPAAVVVQPRVRGRGHGHAGVGVGVGVGVVAPAVEIRPPSVQVGIGVNVGVGGGVVVGGGGHRHHHGKHKYKRKHRR